MRPLELSHRTVSHPKNILTHFQPIVSVKSGSVVAMEALSRGHLPELNISFPPDVLFNLATTTEDRLTLDRLCRKLAMKRFAPIHKARRELLLNVNLDMSLVSKAILGSGKFLQAAEKADINPSNIVIEIIESSVQDTDILTSFIDTYRQHGFLIALDDIGTGHSNLDRISQIKPDIIKIDKGLIRDIHREYHKFEIAKALVRLSRNIGAMVIAEGVETEEEVMELMGLGVDIFQGFYFARPAQMEGKPPPTPRKLGTAARIFRRRVIDTINEKKALHETYDQALTQVIEALGRHAPRQFDACLVDLMHCHDDIECMYVLNGHGRQVSSTMCNPYSVSESKRFIYQPAPRGADHSLKEYYLPLSAGLDKFTTEPYISLASGNLCSTISIRFHDKSGHPFILCVDISVRRR